MWDRVRRLLELIANIAILATCLAVAYVLFSPQSPTPERRGPQALTKGDRLELTESFHLDRADHTLIMVLRSGCQYCTDSMPFYNRLARKVKEGQAKRQLQLVVVSRDDAEQTGRYLRTHDLNVQLTVPLTPALAQTLRVPGTPVLIHVDRTGMVKNVWVGKLDPDGENDVELNLFSGPSTRVSSPRSSTDSMPPWRSSF
jgi:thioredoxin-related protein